MRFNELPTSLADERKRPLAGSAYGLTEAQSQPREGRLDSMAVVLGSIGSDLDELVDRVNLIANRIGASQINEAVPAELKDAREDAQPTALQRLDYGLSQVRRHVNRLASQIARLEEL